MCELYVCVCLPIHSSLYAALRTRYGIGDDDLLHQVAIGFEADGLPGLRGERVQLLSQEEISGLNLINILRCTEKQNRESKTVAIARFLYSAKDRYYS